MPGGRSVIFLVPFWGKKEILQGVITSVLASRTWDNYDSGRGGFCNTAFNGVRVDIMLLNFSDLHYNVGILNTNT